MLSLFNPRNVRRRFCIPAFLRIYGDLHLDGRFPERSLVGA